MIELQHITLSTVRYGNPVVVSLLFRECSTLYPLLEELCILFVMPHSVHLPGRVFLYFHEALTSHLIGLILFLPITYMLYHHICILTLSSLTVVLNVFVLNYSSHMTSFGSIHPGNQTIMIEFITQL